MSRVSVQDWPRLTRFYGIPPSELAVMPYALLQVYAEELFVLTAEEAMLGFITADIPYTDAKDRNRVFRAYKKWLPSEEPKKLDPHSAEGAAILAGMGIGIPAVESPVEMTEQPTTPES